MRTELLRERYEPLEVVGRGGEGEVIRALDHLHDRQVALKVRPVADEASRTHLLSEARLLLSLSPHPGLPLVREDFFVDERYVIAMDWIEGTDLEALLDVEGRPGLDPALAIGYLEQAAEALEHLHTHDPPVVHGDVKPANLILTSSGRVVLVDFGLSSTPTDELRRAGTAGYVAPEVAAGARPTAASDVYSLAATALTLLTGEAPSRGAPSWGAIERERIPALERIVRPNLATDPGRRDASAAAFVARLQRWWGAALPSGNGHARARRPRAPCLRRTPRRSVDEVARAHRGNCVSPVDDGPLMVAFASAEDGFDAARELAGRFDARVAAVTGEAEPRAGSYRGESASGAARLLKMADRGQVLIDDPTAETIDGRLPPEIGLAEVADASSPTSPPAWALVAPGLSIPPRADTCPYRGLMAFGSEDGDLFFGREEVVASILDRLLDSGFMAVVGASGSGKSSLVRAGLVPAYRRAREGPVVVMTPGSDPAAELERSLSAGPPSLLIVDQLEEVFTLCPDEASRTRFFDALMDLRGDELRVARGRPPGGLLRTLRRPSSPRRRAGRAPAPAGADADRRASPGDRGSRPRGRASTRGRPGRRDAGRRRRRARRPPAALPRPLRVVGSPRRSGPHPGGLPRGRRCAGGDRAHGRGGLRRLQSAGAGAHAARCSSGSPSSARRRRTPGGGSRWRS